MVGQDLSEYKYFAFISYNAKDTRWGKRLQRKLEHYRMPATLCSERGWKRKPMDPVFFAPYDIQPGPLSEELKERLKASKNLIVICSPNSAQSEWVGKEIEYFHELGRGKAIHFFIVKGIPNCGDPTNECFNPVINQLGLSKILGANIHEKIFWLPWLNRERAYIQLISKLLGVEFDSIWKRHKRQLIVKTIAWIIGLLFVFTSMILIWVINQPFDVKLQLKEASIHNPNLPPMKDAVISFNIGKDLKRDTIQKEGGFIIFKDLAHKYLGHKVRMTFTCPDFVPIDTIVVLSREVTLKVSRDPTVYGNIQFKLCDEYSLTPISGAVIQILEYQEKSHSDGKVLIKIPLDKQSKEYIITSPNVELLDSILEGPFISGSRVVLTKNQR